MMTKRERAQQFVTRTLRGRQTKDDPRKKPFLVAYDTGNAFNDGEALTIDQFYHVLEDYDAVIVKWKEGPHPSQKEHFLLYRDAKDIDLRGEGVEEMHSRTRSHEIVGDFDWFKHGEGLPVDMSIGFHCRHDATWHDLP